MPDNNLTKEQLENIIKSFKNKVPDKVSLSEFVSQNLTKEQKAKLELLLTDEKEASKLINSPLGRRVAEMFSSDNKKE